MKKMIWITGCLAVALLAALFCAGCFAVRQGYESAPCKVIRKDGAYELRQYPAITIVEVPMRSTNQSRADDSFMRLFRYISGSNETSQKIPMTTPVFMNESGTNATMSFVMPAKMNPASTPKPRDDGLAVRQIEAGEFAVYRFSGSRSATNESKSLALLKNWMQTNNLPSAADPIYGYFDPPWTPPFMRRNEVMLRVTPDPH